MKALIISLILLFLFSSCSSDYDLNEEYKLGLENYSKGELKNSIRHFSRVINRTDTCMSCVLHRGWAYRDLSLTSKAKKDFTTLIELGDKCLGYGNRGGVWYDMNDFENALEDYKKGYQYCEDTLLLMNMMTHMYFFTDKRDSACIYYNKAIQYDSSDFNPMIIRYCDSKK